MLFEETAVDIWQSIPASSRFRLRYLSLPDSWRERRQSWMHEVFGETAEYPFRENDVRFLSRLEGTFDVLLVGGNDAPRVARILREHVAALAGIAVVSVMTGSSVDRRALVLKAGCDACFDTASMAPEEARLRLGAIMQRYEARQRDAMKERAHETMLREIADCGLMTTRERRLVSYLIGRRGMTASYAALNTLMSQDMDPISTAHLRVVVSKLRKKLRNGARIVAEGSWGYRLRISPN